ncbi:MAG: hypothetical protein AAB152_14600 [Candidatus Coatesbacteria bacterium]
MPLRLRPPRRTAPLRLMKKFRFQLLSEWIAGHLAPCRVADIGGGKGLLAYLLDARGFAATVVDPLDQPLPPKYKDLAGVRHALPAGAAVRRISKAFDPAMAADYDLLVGLHAHGSNMKILEAAARYGAGFILLPCCVIDEPIEIRPNVDWFESLIERARALGFDIGRFELNFRGQCRGFFATGTRARIREAAD